VKNVAITVTEAARNFADCVNRVHYQNTTFILVKNGTPVARLVPVQETACTGRDLLDALTGVSLSAEEAEAWRKDLEDARGNLKLPIDKWR
jgi:prevent-host-death family protein